MASELKNFVMGITQPWLLLLVSRRINFCGNAILKIFENATSRTRLDPEMGLNCEIKKCVL